MGFVDGGLRAVRLSRVKRREYRCFDWQSARVKGWGCFTLLDNLSTRILMLVMFACYAYEWMNGWTRGGFSHGRVDVNYHNYYVSVYELGEDVHWFSSLGVLRLSLRASQPPFLKATLCHVQYSKLHMTINDDAKVGWTNSLYFWWNIKRMSLPRVMSALYLSHSLLVETAFPFTTNLSWLMSSSEPSSGIICAFKILNITSGSLVQKQ